MCHGWCCVVGCIVYIDLISIYFLFFLQGRVCRPLFVVENNRLRIRKKHINDLHDPNYGWTNLMQQVGLLCGGLIDLFIGWAELDWGWEGGWEGGGGSAGPSTPKNHINDRGCCVEYI